MQQGVDQRSRPVTRRRMNHHSLGLVHDHDIRIFVEDLEGDRLGLDGRHRSFGILDFQHVPVVHLPGQPSRPAVEAHLDHPPLDLAACEQPEGTGDVGVDPGSRRLEVSDLEAKGLLLGAHGFFPPRSPLRPLGPTRTGRSRR